MTTSIHFKPDAAECRGQDGESLLDIALNHDVPIQHACGGFCACTTCHIYVLEGADFLTPVEDDEKERLAAADDSHPNSRLACQARIKRGSTGPVVVQRVKLD